MKTRCLFTAAAAGLLLLAACTHEMTTARVSDEGEVRAAAGNATLSYDYDVEYVTGGVAPEVMDKINRYIISREIFFDESETGTDVPAACKRWAEDLINGYQIDTQDYMDDYDSDSSWMFNWEYSMSGSFAGACRSRHLQTYMMEDSDYTGGAHGMYAETYVVFDLTTGEVVRHEDLLRDGCQEELSEMISDRILEDLDEEFTDAIFGTPGPNDNFSVDESGITWHYNPYEIAPYVLGVIEAQLSWKELEPFLKQ